MKESEVEYVAVTAEPREKSFFERISLGHLLITVTLLECIIVYLLSTRIDRLATHVETNTEQNTTQTQQLKNLEWYRDQGVDFSMARKLQIKPQSSPTKNHVHIPN